MRKIILSTIGAIVIGLSGLSIAPSTAQAGIAVGSDGKLKLFGTVRFRLESDVRQNTGGKANQDRLRPRLRLRFGGAYQANENWSMGFRLATNSSSLNSPHHTFGLLAAGDNANFGLDRAFIKYKRGDLSVWAGKNGMNLWTQTEVFWDEDTQPEGVAATYKFDPITINAGYFALSSPSWGPAGNDVYMGTAQAVAAGSLGGAKLKAGIAYAGLTNVGAAPGFVNSDSGYTIGLQAKTGGFRLGGEYFQGSASTENAGYTLQARYKPGWGIGLRVYYYDVEAYALPADGFFTQDNFPSGNANAVNFQGWRFQVDYKVAKNVSMDFRLYTMKAKTTNPVPTAGTIFGAKGNIMKRPRWTRVQWNTNVKF
jgi:hypothetical protein